VYSAFQSMLNFSINAERQSARMSKITNDGLTRRPMLYSCTVMATVGVKGLSVASPGRAPVCYCVFLDHCACATYLMAQKMMR